MCARIARGLKQGIVGNVSAENCGDILTLMGTHDRSAAEKFFAAPSVIGISRGHTDVDLSI